MSRKNILARRNDWVDLAGRFTDQFSSKSIINFLTAIEEVKVESMLPFLIPFEFETFNKVSRHFSFVPTDNEIYVDVGAFDGDSVAKFIDDTPSGGYDQIYAFEPNPSSFLGLKVKTHWIPRLHAFQMAVGSVDGHVNFLTAGGSQSARVAMETVNTNGKLCVKACQLDTVIEHCSLLKVDVEGSEVDVVKGAAKLISNNAPNLVIDTCHYADDVLKVYDAVMSCYNYKYAGIRFPHSSLCVHALYFSDSYPLVD